MDKTGGAVVLVVDDDADNRTMYCEFLTHAGYRVLEAADGHEAVALATAQRPDAVVMDLVLPGLDGYEVTRRLRAEDATRDVAVVVVSGLVHADSKRRAHEIGIDSFLDKPCLPIALEAELRRLLRRSAESLRE